MFFIDIYHILHFSASSYHIFTQKTSMILKFFEGKEMMNNSNLFVITKKYLFSTGRDVLSSWWPRTSLDNLSNLPTFSELSCTTSKLDYSEENEYRSNRLLAFRICKDTEYQRTFPKVGGLLFLGREVLMNHMCNRCGSTFDISYIVESWEMTHLSL